MTDRQNKFKTTIVVSQRERVETVLWSLESLFSTIDPEVPVIVVDGTLPEVLKSKLRNLQKVRPFRHVSKPHFIPPGHSRNIGAALSETEFIAFVDNDIQYQPGWLEALEANAERNRSSVVAPLTCIGLPAASTIHHAGGVLFAEGDPDHPTLSERHRLMDKPISQFNRLTAPERNEIAEFHCLLMRRDVLDEFGSFDERLVSREQIDFALRLKIAGKTVTFERDAVVTHVRDGKQSQADLDFFLQRWDHSRVETALSVFESTWGVALDKERILHDWIARHRRRAVGESAPLTRRLLGETLFNRFVVPFYEARSRRRWPKPGVHRQTPTTDRMPDQEERSRIFDLLTRRFEPIEGLLPSSIPTKSIKVAGNLEAIAGMATMPSRSDTAPSAIASILPQVDHLYLFLDGFAEVPLFAQDPKIRPLLSSQHGDLKANGKFLGLALHEKECLYFSLDDDIAYPDNYVSTMRASLKDYDYGAVVGVHASTMNQTIDSYLRDRVVVHRSRGVISDFQTDVLGTCSTAFATQRLRFDVREWRHVNMVDLSFAQIACEREIPLVGLARTSNWLVCLAEEQDDSIFVALQLDDSRQTEIARSLFAPEIETVNYPPIYNKTCAQSGQTESASQ